MAKDGSLIKIRYWFDSITRYNECRSLNYTGAVGKSYFTRVDRVHEHAGSNSAVLLSDQQACRGIGNSSLFRI